MCEDPGSDVSSVKKENKAFHCRWLVREGLAATLVTQRTPGSDLTNGSNTVS